MSLKICITLCVCILFGFCQSAYVDLIEKCSIHDSECQTKLYSQIMRSTTQNGIPEYGIPPTDPFEVKNVTISVLDLIKVTMTDGVTKGIKNCVIHKVNTNLDIKNFTMDFTCNLVIKGKYKLTSNPAVQSLIGGAVHGEGLTKVEIEKIRIRVGFEFFLRRGKDGEIYCDYKYEGMHFAFTFRHVKIQADHIYIGNQELSGTIMKVLNENWKFFLTNFGGPFVQKGMDLFFMYTHMFYDNVPAKDYIIEDLSPYLSQ